MRLQTPSSTAARQLFAAIDDALGDEAPQRRRHSELARELDVSLSRVKNLARLVKLPAPIKAMIRAGKLSPAHAELLLGQDPATAQRLASAVAAKQLTVSSLRSAIAGKPIESATAVDPNIAALEQEISELLSTDVRVQVGNPASRPPRPGQLVVQFWSNDELDGLLEVMRLGKATIARRFR